jgi:rod shape determining protein RodA
MLRIDRRLIAHFDWTLLACTLLVVGCGLVTVLSATHAPERLVSSLFVRQVMWSGVGVVALLLAISFDYHWLERYAWVFYSIGLLALLLIPLVGASGGGARRWISLGPFTVQPSEFVKVALVVAVAGVLHRDVGEGALPLRRLRAPLLLLLPIVFLVLRQPDLGTAVVLVITMAAMLVVAGLRLRLILATFMVAAPVVPFLWSYLKPYQQRRILTFIDPQADPLGSGYHIIQSKIAIGSGMFAGKGYLQGTQNQLNFLPEQHTDFIFSVFAEEWGFAGAALLLALYAVLLTRCILVASRARDTFGALLAAGLTGIVFSQVLINIGMATGSLPVVGITLPFFSYGGSSLVVCMMAMGLLMNVSMRRFIF